MFLIITHYSNMHLVTPTLFLTLIVSYGVYSFDFLKPSFVSDWRYIKSQGGAKSEVVVVHGLNVLPYKVVTEVLVNDSGRQYIFHAMGSALGDDDYNYTIGGIIYLYDDNNVRVLAPSVSKSRRKYNTGIAIYTGNNKSWDGPNYISNIYTEAMVRVKVFIPCDFPLPDFQSKWTSLSVNDATTYQEVNHTLDDYPEFVILQVKNKNNYVSEGLGSTSILEARKNYHQVGGVVYGFSKNYIRIWYPSNKGKKRDNVCIMCFYDGWGLNDIKNTKTGSFRVLAWKSHDKTANSVFRTNLSAGSAELNINKGDTESFVTVEIEAVDGSNDGFRFYGVGSTVNDGVFGSFGGLIYAFNETNLVYWTPKYGTNGYLINIGEMWGVSGSNNIKSQVSSTGIIRMVVFNFKSEEICCKNETIDESSTEMSISGLRYRDEMNYTCKYGHNVTGGNEMRKCQINGQWGGDPLNCSRVTCPHFEIKSNITVINATGFRYNDNVTYVCSSDDMIRIEGDMFRTCLGNGTWSGTNPTCVDIACPSDIINIKRVTANATGFGHRDNVTYECDKDNPVMVSGDFHRTCLANNTWSGMDPVCEPCMCPCYLLISKEYNKLDADSALKAEIEAIKQQLSVNKKNTANFLRSKISAPDKRKSAESVGYIGFTIIILIVLVIILPDIHRLYQGIKKGFKRMHHRNVSRVYPK